MKYYVYFIQAGENGPIKIGKARRVEKRLEQLQTGNHLELRIMQKYEFDSQMQAFTCESAFHKKYANSRLRGEWFKASAFNFGSDELKELKQIALHATRVQKGFDRAIDMLDIENKARLRNESNCENCGKRTKLVVINGKERIDNIYGGKHRCGKL